MVIDCSHGRHPGARKISAVSRRSIDWPPVEVLVRGYTEPDLRRSKWYFDAAILRKFKTVSKGILRDQAT